MNKYLEAPFTKDKMKELRAGDYVFISGTIYTARDAAHKRMYEALAAGDKETGAKHLGNILRLRDYMLTLDLMPAYSAAMNLLGWEGIFNQDYCTPYSEETKEKMRKEMQEIGEL